MQEQPPEEAPDRFVYGEPPVEDAVPSPSEELPAADLWINLMGRWLGTPEAEEPETPPLPPAEDIWGG